MATTTASSAGCRNTAFASRIIIAAGITDGTSMAGGDNHKGRKLGRQLRQRAAEYEDRVSRLTGMIAALETERLRAIVEASRLRAQAEQAEQE